MGLKSQIQNREIKFRVWDNVDYMSSPFNLHGLMFSEIEFTTDCPIMQFTGLLDKNGKEIYEGDIVKGVTGYIFKIVFSDGSFMILSGLKHPEKNKTFLIYNPDFIEIIGNIYQNPELLETVQK